jgi:hypothetical protein
MHIDLALTLSLCLAHLVENAKILHLRNDFRAGHAKFGLWVQRFQ